ncbi:ATP-binding protein [Actinomadura macrotermitis]|uniref:Histidine kinase/HSP90-like ATPase domain-containing protein n=1 Tax=Actinomadura macrotermitis TaxID=2585200 RepID=A0A7K0C1Z4_9ACTN|nr:ATP-binding protein [Actinomadura macrotermitis]MQY06814.1 hypothetical protein [Actinomadura macrotermitis]
MRGWRPGAARPAAGLACELATNALKHAALPSEQLLVSLYLTDDSPVVEVRDGSGEPPRLQGFDDESTSGRGLAMVDAMVASWGHERLASGGKCVYAVLRTSA